MSGGVAPSTFNEFARSWNFYSSFKNIFSKKKTKKNKNEYKY